MSKKKMIILSTICIILSIVMGTVGIYALNKKPAMTAEQVVSELQRGSLPIDGVIVYDENTDENKLLGRPNQYISKVNFADTRLEQFDPASPNGGTIEVFTSASDLNRRKAHNEMVMEKYPIFTEYLFVHGKYIMRLSKDLSPEQAKEYEEMFMSIK